MQYVGREIINFCHVENTAQQEYQKCLYLSDIYVSHKLYIMHIHYYGICDL